jgi:hypothetical protein
MKKQKKFGRKLSLNKQTIASLGKRQVVGGATGIVTECIACPCGQTIATEVICSLVDCYTINTPTCQTCDCPNTAKSECGSCDTCQGSPCPCQMPLTY